MPMTRALTSTIVLYRLALRLYPAAFRNEFGAELLRDIEIASEESWRARRWRGLVEMWARTIVDLTLSIVVQRTRAGWPVVTWMIGAVTAATLIVAWHIYRGAWDLVGLRGDHEVAVLLVAVSAVLLVVVCTLTFTMWLVRPHRQRHR